MPVWSCVMMAVTLFRRALLDGVYFEFRVVFVEMKGGRGRIRRSGTGNEWTSSEGRTGMGTSGSGTGAACKDWFLEFPVKLDICTGKLADDALAKTLP